MAAKEENEIADAIKDLAEAVNKLADAIAIDEPLNYSIGRGLQAIADAGIQN